MHCMEEEREVYAWETRFFGLAVLDLTMIYLFNVGWKSHLVSCLWGSFRLSNLTK